jgi:hypothetical protein
MNRCPKIQPARLPMKEPKVSAIMSLIETVRGGKKIWVNSIAKASKKQAIQIKTNKRIFAERFECFARSVNHKKARGIIKRMLATQSAND